jgi:hypothetical protein
MVTILFGIYSKINYFQISKFKSVIIIKLSSTIFMATINIVITVIIATTTITTTFIINPTNAITFKYEIVNVITIKIIELIRNMVFI